MFNHYANQLKNFYYNSNSDAKKHQLDMTTRSGRRAGENLAHKISFHQYSNELGNAGAHAGRVYSHSVNGIVTAVMAVPGLARRARKAVLGYEKGGAVVAKKRRRRRAKK